MSEYSRTAYLSATEEEKHAILRAVQMEASPIAPCRQRIVNNKGKFGHPLNVLDKPILTINIDMAEYTQYRLYRDAIEQKRLHQGGEKKGEEQLKVENRKAEATEKEHN